jgi:beta-fructofuranosidase
MNWRPEGVPPHRGKPPHFALQHTDFFAPESLLTKDGRRVMWAWLPTLDLSLQGKTIQSLPRELSLGDDGTLRIAPLRELETLREEKEVFDKVTLDQIPEHAWGHHEEKTVTQLSGEAHEIRLTVAREEANRRRLGLRIFAHANNPNLGVPIIVDPATRTLQVGDISAPFAVADLPEGEDLELRVFIDKYLVEVFANDRQAVVTADLQGWRRKQRGVALYAYGRPTTFQKLETWSLSPTTAGFHEATRNRIWKIEAE